MPEGSESAQEVIGIMTGTSIDAMDAALVRMVGVGRSSTAAFIGHISVPLEPLDVRLRDAAEQKAMSAGDFAQLAWDFGLAHAEAVSHLLKQHPATPSLIAVHGQTVFHRPPYSWQLVNPAPIAAKFACPVVYDLRQALLAQGGEGAPITPAADWVLFRDAHKSRGIVNLGGFCNVSIVPADAQPQSHSRGRGFDVCACNQVLDAVARNALGSPFDADGNAAAKGRVHPDATERLVTMLRDQRSASRSLGTGDEAMTWVFDHCGAISGEDLAASAVYAVGQCISEALAQHVLDEIVIAGGGTRNKSLLRCMRELIHVPVLLADELGIPADAREAVCIAVLGHMALTERRACSIALPETPLKSR